ncbi:CHAT domain-containing tetratricopeptide repeat protein [Bernardetia sp. Wsw4-3y2]|uniref:CHAT domain-containing protein n=1 Tax=Bernardetia sp. Wsw4-3y2 TaxID=3127471 RepID=UPI0030D32E5F
MKIKIYSVLLFFFLVFFSFSFFSKAQNNSESDIFYQSRINSLWQNNQIDSTLIAYGEYLAELNPKKETSNYINFQIQRLKIAYLVGNIEVVEKSIQELKELKLNDKKETELAHQIIFQEAKYLYWKGFYQKAVNLFKQIPNYQELKSYQLANRYANVSDINLDFLEIETFEDSKFETASEQTELLSQLFTSYGMPTEALSYAQKSIDYLPQTANEIEKVDAQIHYTKVLLLYQLKVRESQVYLDEIQEKVAKYAPQTELELRFHVLSMTKLFIERKMKEVVEISDSVWVLCQKTPATNSVFQDHIRVRSAMLLETRKWDEEEKLLDEYIEQFSKLYSQESHQVQQLYAHKSLLYFYQNFYQKAVDYSDKILQNPVASVYLEIDVYKINAIAYSKINNYDKSFFYAEKYLELTKKALGESHVQVANVYSLVASIYSEQNNLQQSVEYSKRAIEIYEAQEQKNFPTAIARSHQVISRVYLKLEQNEKALFHSLQAKKILEELFLKDRFYILSQTYSSLGIVYRSLEKYDSAYHYYHLSLAAENTLPEKNRNHANIGRAYNNLGYAFEKHQNYDSAIYYYQKALIEKQNNEKTWTSANVLNNLANCFAAISDFTKAENNYRKSLEVNVLGKEYADIEIALDSYKGLATLNKFPFAQQLNYYRKADEIIDKMRSQLHTDNDQLLISKLTTEIYGKALSTCFEATKMKTVEEQIYEDAFYFAEKNRASLLRKQTQEALVMTQVPENLRKLDVNYSSLIDYYQREIEELENTDSQEKSESQIAKLAYYNQQILETRNKNQKLKNELSEKFKSYKNLQEPNQLATTQTIKENLKENEQMIVYQWFEPYLFVQIISKDKQLFYRIKPIDFEETLKKYRNCLAKDCSIEKFVVQSDALYKILIQPIESHIKTSQKLIIIPDAILQQIPFSTLLSTSNQESNLSNQNINYPLLKKEISFHYSSSLWAAQRQSKNQINYEYEFVGFAPVFEDQKENNSNLVASNRSNLSSLPYSKKEVEEIANLFTNQEKNALAFVNLKANQENLKSYATKTRRLHLATHSQTFTKTPFNSHIWLFGKDSITKDKETPQKFYASDLYGMSFPNELVVLSSCRSGVGQVVEGEGVITLTRSFLNAGTKNVLFSLWQIDDLATKELMTFFYESVSEGKSYSESLQLAKQKLSKSEKFKNPFYWAGILLIGE